MYRPTAMVKFFTQCCPRCSANAEPSKCLSIIKGQIVPTREYADDKKDSKESDDPAFSKEKSSDASSEAAFEKKARKALEELKRQTDKEEGKSKPKD